MRVALTDNRFKQSLRCNVKTIAITTDAYNYLIHQEGTSLRIEKLHNSSIEITVHKDDIIVR